MSDIEIARNAKLKKITEIAKQINIDENEILPIFYVAGSQTLPPP